MPLFRIVSGAISSELALLFFTFDKRGLESVNPYSRASLSSAIVSPYDEQNGSAENCVLLKKILSEPGISSEISAHRFIVGGDKYTGIGIICVFSKKIAVYLGNGTIWVYSYYSL